VTVRRTSGQLRHSSSSEKSAPSSQCARCLTLVAQYERALAHATARLRLATIVSGHDVWEIMLGTNGLDATRQARYQIAMQGLVRPACAQSTITDMIMSPRRDPRVKSGFQRS
jgi:hypothetical protein